MFLVYQITNVQREYPMSSNGGSAHAWNAPMRPFEGLYNAHGLSEHYTNYYYQCHPRPSGAWSRHELYLKSVVDMQSSVKNMNKQSCRCGWYGVTVKSLT